MIKEIKNENDNVNIYEEKNEILREVFPECFTNNGKFDLEKFENDIKQNISTIKEGYGLNFLGKNYAKYVSALETETILVPDENNNNDINKNSNNVFISGDNIDALKHLTKSYTNQIKCIYIDPPYNTGTDGFVYNDKFSLSIDKMIDVLDISEEEAKRLFSMTNAKSNSHSAWLTFMYSRLYIAKQLLNEQGIIFISIDDNEQANLKLLCDNIFGEENFVGCAVRVTKKSNNKGDFWAPNFDYLLTYTKDREYAKEFTGGVNESSYNLIEEEGPRKGEKYQLIRLYMSSIQNRNPEQRFWIECPDGSKIIPPGTTFPPERPKLGDGIWRWTRSTYEKNIDKIVIKKVSSSNLLNENKEPAKWNVYTKTYLNDVLNNSTAKPNSLIEDHINQIASHELNELEIPFDYAKPTTLIEYLMKVARLEDGDIILDFFAGSGSTAHAVMKYNSNNNKNIRYISVQLPEPCDEKSEAFTQGYKTIDELSMERIRRASKKIKEETKANIDYGFKHYTINEIKLNTLDKLEKFEPNWIDQDETIINDFGIESILTTWMNYDGYGLNCSYSVLKLDNYEAYKCENTIYLINPNISDKAIKLLIEKYEKEENFDCNRIVIFGYSFNLNEIQTLKDNIKQVKNIKNINVDLITRY